MVVEVEGVVVEGVVLMGDDGMMSMMRVKFLCEYFRSPYRLPSEVR